MSPRDEVHRLLGPPEHSFPTWNKSGYSEHYADGAYNVGYDNAWLADHVGFSPGAVEVMINAQLIWSGECQQDPNPIFLALDPEPVEFVGFWNFLQLGVTTTGYHDDDESQRGITVFPRPHIDYLVAKAKPADTSRYTAA